MGRGRSIDPTRRAFLEQQAAHFSIEPTLPAEVFQQPLEQLQLALFLDQQQGMDRMEAQVEQQLGKLRLSRSFGEHRKPYCC